MKIPFSKLYLTGNEVKYVTDAINSRELSGNNQYSQKCIDLIRQKYPDSEIFLVPSGTDALEMGTIVAQLEPGDEVIMPSYTFSSTANAVLLSGAKPVFCEVGENSLNIDPLKIENLITKKTKMILSIDYAGIPCEYEEISNLAKKYNLIFMSDAAQSFGSRYKSKFVGSECDLVTFSFHESKNISCGEGGALIVNNKAWFERAIYTQEKGTDRRLVINGVKSKYHWVVKGSSFLLSEIQAAMLLTQLENENIITEKRAKVVSAYKRLFEKYSNKLKITPYSEYEAVNQHAFWVLFDNEENKNIFQKECISCSIYPYIGYMPLHSSPMGNKLGYKSEDLPYTEKVGKQILRLPIYTDLAEDGLDYCIEKMSAILKKIY